VCSVSVDPIRATRPDVAQLSVTALRIVWWLARFALALFVFVGALQLMKTGAARLDLLSTGGFLVKNAASTLGLGWVMALMVLSGSPIAATSLTLVAAGEQAAAGTQHFTEIQGFTMLTGSRLGAAFVVLVTAVVFAIRGGKGRRRAPLSTAVICLVTTAIVYVPAAFIGFGILKWDRFHALEPTFGGTFADVVDLVYGDLVREAKEFPSGLVFLAGLGALLLAFKLIDSVMPTLDSGTVEGSRARYLTRKWPMFALGSAVALITMSVAIALTVLVPLVAKNYVKRSNIIPYIMGANITTLGDTMLAAFALNSPGAARIVIAEVIATSTLSIILLAFFYPQLTALVRGVERFFVGGPVRLAGFTLALFAIPLSTILIAGLVG
jgi:solute carrier family 34 (sodium-dependent phosphate cotransporter)